ncbi:MAG: PASTA domain-containing protein [Solirubrobacteraceae bacterium]
MRPLEPSHRLRRNVCRGALLALALAALPASADAQATRTWVSGVGDDINPCSRTAPCKTLAGTITKTAAGGEINAIDSAGFGTVTITKSITIDLRSVLGGVLNASTTGVIVNAAPTDVVILRGLDILGSASGAPAACPGSGGLRGVWLRSAGKLRVEDTRISQQRQAGILVAPEAAGTDVVLNRVDIDRGCGPAIGVEPAAPHTADVLVRDSTLSGFTTGLHAKGAGARVRLGSSAIFGNGRGLLAEGGGEIASFGTNMLIGNDVDGAPSRTIDESGVVQTPPAPVTTTVTTPAPPPTTVTVTVTKPAPPPTTPKRYCVVPRLAGLTLTAARTRLKKARCRLGKVTRRKVSGGRKVGRVLTQRTKAGKRLAVGAHVRVTIGRR